jgi:hypothetical protein
MGAPPAVSIKLPFRKLNSILVRDRTSAASQQSRSVCQVSAEGRLMRAHDPYDDPPKRDRMSLARAAGYAESYPLARVAAVAALLLEAASAITARSALPKI